MDVPWNKLDRIVNLSTSEISTPYYLNQNDTFLFLLFCTLIMISLGIILSASRKYEHIHFSRNLHYEFF